MAKTLFSSSGEVVQLGRELGRGGEGAVFELVPDSFFVAKVYLKPLDNKKQDKLRYMPTLKSERLNKYVAWPHAALTDGKAGPVVGYLMPKVAKHSPVQMWYSPARRRQDHPKAAWDFLVYVARNVAAAFEVLHADGHVLGDVNQGNVMVASDSTVVLIDSDSFQINANGTLHYCEVGVAHFTPPELQGLPSFSGYRRSANHDNFGLALLIFHILFGGRHPYSGVPLRDGVGDALETDIKHFRYAYAKDGATRGLAPPPRAIPVGILPGDMEWMFQVAFTEKGAGGQRPTAAQWVAALDRLRQTLRPCAASKMHLFPGQVKECPWCALEKQGVQYFVDLGTAYVKTNNSFNLVQVWALVEAIQPPKSVVVPVVTAGTKTGVPLPDDATKKGNGKLIRIVAVIAALVMVSANLKLWFLASIIAALGWYFGKPTESKELVAERARRHLARERAKQEMNDIIRKGNQLFGLRDFTSRKNDLVRLRDEYQGLAEAEKKELSHLHSTAEKRQREIFLERFFIDTANIPGLGPARKAALRSFGIETAADVKKSRVMQVKGFGESRTRALTDWRAACERKFSFNPAQAISQADKNVVRAKYGTKETQIEQTIMAKLSELKNHVQNADAQSLQISAELERAAARLAQAEADVLVANNM